MSNPARAAGSAFVGSLNGLVTVHPAVEGADGSLNRQRGRIGIRGKGLRRRVPGLDGIRGAAGPRMLSNRATFGDMLGAPARCLLRSPSAKTHSAAVRRAGPQAQKRQLNQGLVNRLTKHRRYGTAIPSRMVCGTGRMTPFLPSLCPSRIVDGLTRSMYHGTWSRRIQCRIIPFAHQI